MRVAAGDAVVIVVWGLGSANLHAELKREQPTRSPQSPHAKHTTEATAARIQWSWMRRAEGTPGRPRTLVLEV